MKSVGFGLLSKLLKDNVSFSEFVESGITEHYFNADEKNVYTFIYTFFREHGVYPSFETVSRETGIHLSFLQDYPNEPFTYWVGKVYQRRSLKIAVTESQKIIDLARDGDSENAIEKARRMYLALEKLNPTAVVHTVGNTAIKVLERHDILQRSSNLMFGTSFGFPYFDEISGGAQPGDFVVLAGRPGTGKSFVLFKMANADHDFGGKPVLVTFEMPAPQCARRIIAMRSKVSTTQLRIGRLSHFGRTKVADACSLVCNKNGWEFPIIEGSNRYTVEDLLAIVQDMGATSVFIDGAYFLRTRKKVSGKFERISEVADILKTEGAMKLGVPVIGTYQFHKRAGKKGGGLGDIYMSDDMAQLGSMVFKLYNDEAEESSYVYSWQSVEYKIIELLKGREGEKGKIRVKYDMLNTIIEQEEILTDYRTFFQVT